MAADVLAIPRAIYDSMLAHCRAALPNEACGLLAGRNSDVEKIYAMTNAEPSPVSYHMEPKEQFLAMKDMRTGGLSMLAIFHSHPSSPAFPSATDKGLAFYDDVVYIIVSFVEKEPVAKGFSIRAEAVSEVTLTIR